MAALFRSPAASDAAARPACVRSNRRWRLLRIGTAHWIHAIRYNMDLTVLLLDNNIYGLTKNQTSPTSPIGLKSNTMPRGSIWTR